MLRLRSGMAHKVAREIRSYHLNNSGVKVDYASCLKAAWSLIKSGVYSFCSIFSVVIEFTLIERLRAGLLKHFLGGVMKMFINAIRSYLLTETVEIWDGCTPMVDPEKEQKVTAAMELYHKAAKKGLPIRVDIW